MLDNVFMEAFWYSKCSAGEDGAHLSKLSGSYCEHLYKFIQRAHSISSHHLKATCNDHTTLKQLTSKRALIFFSLRIPEDHRKTLQVKRNQINTKRTLMVEGMRSQWGPLLFLSSEPLRVHLFPTGL